MTKVDLLLTNAQVYNVYLLQFEKKQVAVKDGKTYWLPADADAVEAAQTVDLTGKYLIPGLVDSHMHIESSMTTPTAFGAQAAQFGTTTVVADAHEIANVAGIKGLQAFMDQPALIDIFYAIPSSVPSTNPQMETTGGVIDEAAVKQLLQDPRVICLGEAMNFKGLTEDGDSSLIKRLVALCRRYRPTMPLEGHCPKYSGEDLARFIDSGITSDHTQQTPASLLEKVASGMFIQLQAKSMSKEVIQTVCDRHLFEHVAIVTDDTMADDLRFGHLNKNVQRAINLGMRPEDAIYLATYTPARRMGLWDRGGIAPGRVADYIVLNDLKTFDIDAVYKNGRLVTPAAQQVAPAVFPKALYHSIQAAPLKPGDFDLTVPQTDGQVVANVIQINSTSTFTKRIQCRLAVKGHAVQWQQAGLALLCVQERYGHHEPLRFALVKGALSQPGAVGATWMHDHHNLMVMGTQIKSMVAVQNRLVAEQGGYVVAQDGRLTADTPLPIGGVIANTPIAKLGAQLQQVRSAMQALGYHHFNEIMSFSTLSLLVSPAIKLSDRGLFDVKTQTPISLFE